MLKEVFILSVILLLLDTVFLTTMSNVFGKIVYKIQNSKLELKILGAVLCYILIVFSIYYFIIQKNASLFDAFLLGIFTYGIFETTNYAIFKKWPLYVIFIDTVWGGILYSLTTYLFRLSQGKRITFY